MTDPNKERIGKHINLVAPTLDNMQINYRIVRNHGLITSDYDPTRWDIFVEDDGVISKIEKG